MSKKQPLNDDSIRVLRAALRTKLGIGKTKSMPAKKKPAREEEEEAPRKQKAERLGYADMVERK